MLTDKLNAKDVGNKVLTDENKRLIDGSSSVTQVHSDNLSMKNVHWADELTVVV
jgi:hypothetical protein